MAKASRNKAAGKGKKASQPLPPISAKLSKAQLLELLAAEAAFANRRSSGFWVRWIA